MPEPLSIYQRRIDRLERKVRRERAITVALVTVSALFAGTLLACPALAIWSSVRGWDAGTACFALGGTGSFGAIASGFAWLFWLDVASGDYALEKARDEYDRAIEQVVRDAR